MKEKLQFDQQALFIQAVANASADILFVMNIDTKEIVYTNHPVAELLGYSAKQIKALEHPVFSIMHEPDAAKMIKQCEDMKTAADGEVREIEYRMKHADGSLLWFRDRNTVFKRDENGVPIEKLGICQDITERKHSEENIRLLNKTLRDKNKELQSVNNEIKTFTSIAAYDYKETLQTLYTNLEYIISRDAKNFSNTGKANLSKAQTAIQKMKLLTDDIVAYSRLQTMDTNRTKVDLNAVIENAIKELGEKISQTGAVVEKQNLPEIIGFPFLLDLLFFHLIDNAVKFRTPNRAPHIRIIYHVSKDRHTGSDVHQISIADNGIGLEHDQAHKVFDMFYRIHGNAYKGSGIGLAICKKIADLHGGTMAIESEPGEGTTVCCFFPIA